MISGGWCPSYWSEPWCNGAVLLRAVKTRQLQPVAPLRSGIRVQVLGKAVWPPNVTTCVPHLHFTQMSLYDPGVEGWYWALRDGVPRTGRRCTNLAAVPGDQGKFAGLATKCSPVLWFWRHILLKNHQPSNEHPGDQWCVINSQPVTKQGVKSVILLSPLQQLFIPPGGSAAAVVKLWLSQKKVKRKSPGVPVPSCSASVSEGALGCPDSVPPIPSLPWAIVPTRALLLLL